MKQCHNYVGFFSTSKVGLDFKQKKLCVQFAERVAERRKT